MNVVNYIITRRPSSIAATVIPGQSGQVYSKRTEYGFLAAMTKLASPGFYLYISARKTAGVNRHRFQITLILVYIHIECSHLTALSLWSRKKWSAKHSCVRPNSSNKVDKYLFENDNAAIWVWSKIHLNCDIMLYVYNITIVEIRNIKLNTNLKNLANHVFNQ